MANVALSDEHQRHTDEDMAARFGVGRMLGSGSAVPHLFSKAEDGCPFSTISLENPRNGAAAAAEDERSLGGSEVTRQDEWRGSTNNNASVVAYQYHHDSSDTTFSADLRSYQQERRTQYLAQKVSELQRECHVLEEKLHHSEDQHLLLESDLSLERKERAALEKRLDEEMEQNKEFLRTRLEREEAAAASGATNNGGLLAWQLQQESKMEELIKEANENVLQEMGDLSDKITKNHLKRQKSSAGKKSKKRRKLPVNEFENQTTNSTCAIM